MITSPTNEKVKFLHALAEKKYRQREGCFVVEGVRLVEEALKSGAKLKLVMYDPDLLERNPRGANIIRELPADRTFPATERVIKAATETVTPQGIVAAVEMPSPERATKEGLAVILDSLRDPGNLGTILRTAEAAGVSTVITTPETVDPYNPKTVRSAMGAHFWLKIIEGEDWAAIEELCADRRIVLATAGSGTAYFENEWTVPTALVLGSEAHGASDKALKIAVGRIFIPMRGRAESLNVAVAAGILMFEAQRQILQKGFDEESKQGEPDRD